MPRRRRPRGVRSVLLWPGAGTGSDHPSLVHLADGIAAAGPPDGVHRLDFPYRLAGRRAPDRAPVLMASVRSAVVDHCEATGSDPSSVVIGGRSMGGRICTMVAAGADGADPLPLAGVVALAYPLHPPGRPDRLRTGHLADLHVPLLVVAGDRDPFGTPDELAAALDLVSGPVTSVTVPGARHELRDAEERVLAAVLDWLAW